MFRPRRMTSRIPNILYVGMGIALVAAALPRLPRIAADASGVFTCVWLLFGLVVIGANLWFALAVHRERGERLARRGRLARGVAEAVREPEAALQPMRRLRS
jgi:hypothetical protein